MSFSLNFNTVAPSTPIRLPFLGPLEEDLDETGLSIRPSTRLVTVQEIDKFESSNPEKPATTHVKVTVTCADDGHDYVVMFNFPHTDRVRCQRAMADYKGFACALYSAHARREGDKKIAEMDQAALWEALDQADIEATWDGKLEVAGLDPTATIQNKALRNKEHARFTAVRWS